MLFIHSELIRYVAESLNKDEDRLKFNWEDFRIRLKDYYRVDHNKDGYVVCKYNIYNLEELKSIKDRYVIEIKLEINENIIDYVNILKDLTNFTHLTFEWSFNQDITPLKDLKNLTHLTFHGDFNQDITPLKDLKNLTHLSFFGRFNCDITPLQNLKNLTYLSFGYYFDRDISALQNLKNLTYLTFSGNFNQDIAPLKELKNLTHLSFSLDFNQDITPLKELKNLTHLSFPGYFNQDSSVLKELKSIRCLKLNINKNNSEEDLYAIINNLPKLEVFILVFEGYEINDLEVDRKIKKLSIKRGYKETMLVLKF